MLSNFAFKSNLRGYNMVEDAGAGTAAAPVAFALACLAFGVERCSLTVSKPELNAPLVSALEALLR